MYIKALQPLKMKVVSFLTFENCDLRVNFYKSNLAFVITRNHVTVIGFSCHRSKAGLKHWEIIPNNSSRFREKFYI